MPRFRSSFSCWYYGFKGLRGRPRRKIIERMRLLGWRYCAHVEQDTGATPTPQEEGFTLIELAIVIMVLGLLMTGAIAGKALLKSAELKATLSEVDAFTIAMESFEQQYGALPGDLTIAESFFGASATDNGNGDGQIAAATEQYTAWDQLLLAKMITGPSTGDYTGVTGAGGSTPGQNVPASRFKENAGFSLAYIAAPGNWQSAIGRNFPDNYVVFATDTSTADILAGGVLLPDDAFALDRKADDGQPDFGKILSNGTTCATNNGPTDATYNLTVKTPVCLLYFSIQH